MKKILSFAILLMLFTSCSTMRLAKFSEPSVKIYEDVSGTKNDLFVKSNEWLIRNFKDATSVIEFSDKEEGVLIGKYLLSGSLVPGIYGTSTDTRIYAKIDIRVKDSKARISIEPIGEWKYDPSGLTIYTYSPEDAQSDINVLMSSFHSALKAQKIDF